MAGGQKKKKNNLGIREEKVLRTAMLRRVRDDKRARDVSLVVLGDLAVSNGYMPSATTGNRSEYCAV